MKKEAGRVGITLGIVTILSCAMLSFGAPRETGGKVDTTSKPSGDVAIIEDVAKPQGEAADATKVLSVFLRESLVSYSSEYARLEAIENDYKKADADAKDKTTKVQLALTYLRQRQDIIDKMLGDFAFVNQRLSENVEALNSIVGDIGSKQSLAEKAAKAAQDTSAVKKEISDLKLKSRDISSKKPAPGSPEYMTWHKQNLELRVQATKALGNLKRSLQSAYVYKQLADGAKISQEQTAAWQEFIAALSMTFSENQEDLLTAKDLTAQYVAFVNAGKAGSEIAQFADFAKEFSSIVGKVSSQQIPVSVDSVSLGAPPPLPPLPSIEEIDVDKIEREYLSNLGPKK